MTKWDLIQETVRREQGMEAKDYIIAKLRGGTTVKALAKEFGIDRKSLHYRLGRLGLHFERTLVVLGEEE